MLESLEQEYRREEDWCGGGERQPEQLLPLVSKHMEQKEAFLKACTLARRNAEVFLKYIHRNSVTMANISGHSVTVTGVAEVTGHSRVPEQQVKGQRSNKKEKKQHTKLRGPVLTQVCVCSNVCRHPQRAAPEREPSSSFLDAKKTSAGPVPAIPDVPEPRPAGSQQSPSSPCSQP